MKTVSIGDTHGIAVVNSVSEIMDEHDKFIFREIMSILLMLTI